MKSISRSYNGIRNRSNKSQSLLATFNTQSLLLIILSSTETLAKGDGGKYEIVNNTAGQKTEEITDDSVTALLLFIAGVLLISLTLFFVIRWFLNLDGRE